MDIKLLNLKNANDLIRFLEEKGRNHNTYYHYTTWDSLEKILDNKTFLLTRGNSLSINDQHEAKMKGAWSVWDKTYIGSFAFGTSENMAMWGLYGLPWEDAIRIAIPKKAMLEWMNSIQSAMLWDGDTNGEVVQNPEVVLTDIVYVSGLKDDNTYRLTHTDKSKTIYNSGELLHIDERPEMTGYIKNYAWRYENEARLIVRFPNSVYADRIAINIPEMVLDEFWITTGPYFEPKQSALYQKLYEEGIIITSGFRGLVKYKKLCSMCAHGSFLQKN